MVSQQERVPFVGVDVEWRPFLEEDEPAAESAAESPKFISVVGSDSQGVDSGASSMKEASTSTGSSTGSSSCNSSSSTSPSGASILQVLNYTPVIARYTF